MKKNQAYKLTATALCVALGLVIPQVFHMFGAGTVFLPMHIPVLLCGFICGGPYGLLCGALTPLVSSLLTGMPPLMPVGVPMMAELAAYGFLTGVLYKKTKNTYLSLILAMLGGRVVSAFAKIVLMGVTGTPFALQAFLTSAFITPWPGIIIQILVIPVLVMALKRAKLLAEE